MILGPRERRQSRASTAKLSHLLDAQVKCDESVVENRLLGRPSPCSKQEGAVESVKTK
jgi:hypothetical protein